jgi:hypothetical protein
VSRPTLLIPVVFPEPELHPMTDMHLAGLNGFDVVLSGYSGSKAKAHPVYSSC